MSIYVNGTDLVSHGSLLQPPLQYFHKWVSSFKNFIKICCQGSILIKHSNDMHTSLIISEGIFCNCLSCATSKSHFVINCGFLHGLRTIISRSGRRLEARRLARPLFPVEPIRRCTKSNIFISKLCVIWH
jgi:hypothetical protein